MKKLLLGILYFFGYISMGILIILIWPIFLLYYLNDIITTERELLASCGVALLLLAWVSFLLSLIF